jgi:hypothetical protein
LIVEIMIVELFNSAPLILETRKSGVEMYWDAVRVWKVEIVEPVPGGG